MQSGILHGGNLALPITPNIINEHNIKYLRQCYSEP
jgi:hypothetical protein